MMLAAIDWLSISINLLLVIFVVVCLLMTLLVLMQRPKQEGLGAAFGGGVTDQVFGARTTNVLQRGTVYLGSLFFLLSLTLAVLIGIKNKKVGTLDEQPTVAEEAAKTQETPKSEDKQPESLQGLLPGAAADQTTSDAPTTDAANPPENAQSSGEAKTGGQAGGENTGNATTGDSTTEAPVKPAEKTPAEETSGDQ
jgi:preprotein translocase subunit SecG